MIKIKQLLIAILVIFCLSIFYFCFNYYQEFRKFATKNVFQELVFESAFVNARVKSQIDDAVGHLVYLTMIHRDTSLFDNLDYKKEQYNKVRTMLQAVKDNSKIITDIFYTDKYGRLAVSTDFLDVDILKDAKIDRFSAYVAQRISKKAAKLGGELVLAKKKNSDGKVVRYVIFTYPIMNESNTIIRGFAVMTISFDDLLNSIQAKSANSIIAIDTQQFAEPQFYITITDTVKFMDTDNPDKLVLYVSVSKPVDEIESTILSSIMSQIRTNVLISVFIGVLLIICFVLIMHSFGILFEFIIEIKNKSVVGQERFFIFEFNETSKLLLKMKKDIASQLEKIRETNSQLKESNAEKEEANKKLENVNKMLENQVAERTLSLQKALSLSNQCNGLNSAIISQRSVLKDDFTPKEVFDAFISTFRQFNLKKTFLFEYKIENEKKMKFSDIEGDIPELEENVKIDTYLNRDGYYIFPLNMKDGNGRLVIHSPVDNIETSILSCVSIFCRDVSIYLDNRVLRNRLSYWAKTDGLTKLGNRAAYEQAMSFYETSLDTEIGLYLIDVNGLKEMNDKQGHERGDALLKTVADRLKKVFASYNADIYRIGGDEFITILHEDELDNSDKITEALIDAQDDMTENLGSNKIVATYAVGFADSRKVPFEMLYKAADAEMYARKEAYYKKRQELFGEVRKPRH